MHAGPEDIFNGNLKLILGLIWTLIRHFQIRSTGKDISTKSALLAWVNTQIPDQHITNFTTNWNSGIALCALVDRIQPGLCPHYATLNVSKGENNCQLGMDIAEEKLNIPTLMEASDLNNKDVDELSVMTYVSYFFKPANNRLMKWIQSKIPDRKVTNFKTDWNNGVNLACLVDSIAQGVFPDCRSLDPHSSLENLVKAMKLAEDHLGVKPVIKPSQIADPNVDELNVVTYLSRFQYAKPIPQPHEITCSGHGLQKAFVGRPAFFQADTSRAGIGELHVTITSVGGTPVTADVNASKTVPGTFDVKYIPNRPGKITIEVSWSGCAIPGSPYSVLILDPSAYSLTGLQIAGGQCARVQRPVLMEMKGTVDVSDLFVMIQHPDAHTEVATVQPKGKEQLAITYTPTRVGKDDVFVKIAGEDIPGSPFTVKVVDPSQCSVSARNPPAGKPAVARQKVTFTVSASEANMQGIVTELKGPSGIQEICLEAKKDGFNLESFEPVSIGNYTVIVTCAGENVRGSPLNITVSDPAKCTVLDNIPRYLQLNKTVDLNISTKGAGPGTLEASSNQSGILSTSVTKGDDDFYTLHLNPTSIGEATIGITWNTEKLSHTPFGVFVCDSSKCSAYGQGLTAGKGKVGEAFLFTVQATEAGRGDLIVKPKGPKSVYAAETKQTRKGMYSVQFISYEIGPHLIDISWGGAPIPNSPFNVLFVKGADAKQITASGDGLKNAIASQTAKFMLLAPESGLFENNTLEVNIAGCGLESKVVSQKQFDPTCGKLTLCNNDSGNGTYNLEYSVPRPGRYTITILCNEENIPSSPFIVNVLPPPDASKCKAFGAAVENPNSNVVGNPLAFQIDSTDGGIGELKVTATDSSSKTVPVYLAEEKTTKLKRIHSVKLHPTTQGTHKVTVLWSNVHIPGSPFLFAASDPSNVTVSNLPDANTFIGVINEPFSFQIDPRNAGKGEIKAACKMDDGKIEVISMKQLENGTFLLTCIPRHLGKMELLLTFNGANLLQVPWVCDVTNLSDFHVIPPKGYGKAKEYVKFVIKGLNKKNAKNLTVTATHTQHDATVKVDFGNDGTSVARFTAKQVGAYQCEVLYGKKHIRGSPFTAQVANPNECKVLGTIPTVIPISQKRDFIVQSKGAGPGKLSYSMEAAGRGKSTCLNCEIRVKSTDPTSHQVHMKSVSCGKCSFSLKWADYTIPDTPVEVCVVDPQKCTFSCPPLLEGPVKQNDTLEVLIDTTQGGHFRPKVLAKGPKAAYNVEISDEKNGTYVAKFSPWQPGDHILEISVGGTHIAGSPAMFEVIKPVDPSKVTVSGPGLQGAIVNKHTEVTVFARESKLFEKGLLAFDFRTTSSSALQNVDYPDVKCRDNGNGSYDLSFVPRTTGVLQFNIQTEGKQVMGSPFNIHVRPEPNAKKCSISGKAVDSGTCCVVHEPVELIVDSTSAGTGSLSVSGTLPDSTTLRIFATVEKSDEKELHIFKFDPTMVGTYMLSIKWGEEDIPGSPFSISVVDPSMCVVDSSISTHLQIGTTQSLIIKTEDAGDGEINVLLKGNGLEASCETKQRGITHVTLSAVDIGKAEVEITFGGNILPHMPLTTSVCDVSKCVLDTTSIDGHSIEVGVPFHFTVEIAKAGIASLQVEPDTSEHHFAIETKETSDDIYDVRCTARTVGKQNLRVEYGGMSIPGSSICITVTDPKKCVISDLPDPKTYIPTIGDPFSFTVDYSMAGPGGIQCEALLSSEIAQDLDIAEHDSIASITCTPKYPGKLQLKLTFDGVDILTKPWIVEIPDPSRFRVTPPKGFGKRREYVKFPITGLTEGTKEISLKAVHPDHDATVKTEPGRDSGTVIARFTAKKIGNYTVDVTLAGQHIEGSPFTVSIIDPEACHFRNTIPNTLHIGEKRSVSLNVTEAGPGEITCLCDTVPSDVNIIPEITKDEEEGHFDITFESDAIGQSTVMIKWGSYDILSTPFEINFVDSSKVKWSSSSLEKGVVSQGDAVQVHINGQDGGQAVPEVKYVGPQSSLMVNVGDNDDSTFTFSLNPWQIGENSLEILWGGHPISNTPINFTVAKAIDARSITATGEGLKYAIAGKSTSIQITTPEAGLLNRGLLSVKSADISEKDDEGEENYPLDIDVVDNGDGTYTATLLAHVDGKYQLSIVHNNEPVLGSPFPITVYAAPDASKCKAYGRALEMKDCALVVTNPVEFTVDTTNAGYGQFSVTAHQPNGEATRVYSLEEKGDKRLHHLKFDPESTGHCSVEILWEGIHIPDSPFDFNIIDPTKCTVSGLPEPGKIVNVSQGIDFTVLANDAGEGSPQVSVYQPGSTRDIALTPSPVSSSVWGYHFRPSVLGTHTTTVKYGGHNIPGSPHHYQVIDPAKFSITNLNLKGKYAIICELVIFSVQGKAIENEDLILIAHGPTADINIESHKKPDESYTCSFVPIEPGEYEVFVECAGNHVNGSPFTVKVADPSKCQILGKIVSILQVGEPEEIILKTRGSGAGELEVFFERNKDNEHIEYTIENQGLDTYSITLTAKKVAELKLGIFWAGYSIPHAPFPLTICDARQCKALGNTLMTKKGKAGEQITFTVVTHRAGNGSLTVKAKGPSALYTVETREVKECTYEVSFTPWEIGEHSIDVFWGPMHIPKSPFMVNIENPMDRVVCNATGPGLKQAISNRAATFKIISNEVGLLDKNALKVSVIGVQSHANVTIKDENNGCYNVKYIAPTPGAYIASIAFYDRQIPGSPFKINVVPGPNASKCRAYGPTLHPNALHTAGNPLELYIDSSEAGYGSLRVYVQGPNDYRPRIFMADDGKGIHSIKFDAMKSGRYFVVIAWAEQHIPGSPFKLKVHPAADASKVKVYGPGLNDGFLGDTGELFISLKRKYSAYIVYNFLIPHLTT